jgi:hypothetical protein
MKIKLFVLNQATSMAFLNHNRWWRCIILILLFIASTYSVTFAQSVLWDKTIGGSGGDNLSVVVATTDGGYLLGGFSSSDKSEDKTEASKGGDDYWVVKLNADGMKEWDKTIGGNGQDQLTALQQTTDGGYILGGSSYSDKSGDKSEENKQTEYFSSDYWLVKLNADGSKAWDKTIGGNGQDELASLQQTSDGGYILGGFSNSDKSGDKSEASIGNGDYWIVKLNTDGTIVWNKTIGGSESDRLTALQQTSDGGYILGGSSDSNKGGDKTEDAKGSDDYWVVKIKADGTEEWDKTLGANGYDNLLSLRQTTDGGYVLGGFSNSDQGGDKTEQNKSGGAGFYDYWVVKLQPDGTKAWDRTIGGNFNDYFRTLLPTPDGGYLLAGSSESGISGDKTGGNKGEFGWDYWVVKLDANGTKTWDKTIGGGGNDIAQSLEQTPDGGWIVGGNSDSGIGGDKTEEFKGGGESGSDYWVVKLNNDDNPCDQAVQSFTLISADTDEELMALQQGDTIDLTTLPTLNLQIRANTIPAVVGRVSFTFDTTAEVVDNMFPYTFSSKIKFAHGPHTLTATPYCEIEDGGGKGTALTVNFQVVSNERIVHIPADRDNTILSTSPESNDGASWALYIGRTGQSGGLRLQRALLRFDLSSIPAGSTIDSAELDLFVWRTGGAATGVALHKATADWGELESTWSHAFFPGTPWATPGGDFEPTASASTGDVVSGPLAISGMSEDVQAWVNNPSANFGWVLRATEEDTPHSAKLLAAREQPADTYRPVLRIVYTLDDTPNPEDLAVESFTLVNASTEQDLMSLEDGDVIDLSALPSRLLSIRANASQTKDIDVVLELSGTKAYTRRELGQPYALFGDEGGSYHAWTPAPGSYTLTATPYSDATGAKGSPLTVSFTVVKGLTLTTASDMEAAGGPQEAMAYPNPTGEGRVQVVLPRETQGELAYTLVSMLGSEVAGGELSLSKPTKELNFDFCRQMQASGIYYLRLRGQGLQAVVKVVRQ